MMIMIGRAGATATWVVLVLVLCATGCQIRQYTNYALDLSPMDLPGHLVSWPAGHLDPPGLVDDGVGRPGITSAGPRH